MGVGVGLLGNSPTFGFPAWFPFRNMPRLRALGVLVSHLLGWGRAGPGLPPFLALARNPPEALVNG